MINDLRIPIQDILLDYFVLSETKLDKSFPTAQFHIVGYEIRVEINIEGILKKVSSVKEFRNLKCSDINLFVQN